MRTTLRIQSVLYKNEAVSLERSLESVVNALRVAKENGLDVSAELHYGDASPERLLSESEISAFSEKHSGALSVRYRFFNENTGTARGHNRMGGDCETEYMLIMNPDVILCPEFFIHAFKPFESEDTGLVEARQTPIEHPKEYDRTTGETSWASTAAALFPTELFKKVGGFDADSFFMYCDDVDFTWRLRLLGKKVIYQPSAIIFHGHRLDKNGKHLVTEAELYYSVESALLMAYKWSNDRWLRELIEICTVGSPYQKKALKEFYRRRDAGLLPERLDSDHKIASFKNGGYSENRYC